MWKQNPIYEPCNDRIRGNVRDSKGDYILINEVMRRQGSNVTRCHRLVVRLAKGVSLEKQREARLTCGDQDHLD